MSRYISGNTEILRVAEAVASEKSIPVEAVMEAIEMGVKTAAKKKYGAEYDIAVKMDRKTGEFKIYRRHEVVELVEDSQTQTSLEEAQKTAPDAEINVGDFITKELPPVDLKRLVASVVKQVIMQKVKTAEKEKEYNLFKDKEGEIVNGLIKKVGFKGILLEVLGAEAFLSKDDTISSEMLKQGERIRAVVKTVVRKESGVQVYLSRTSNDFMAKLFAQEVPEIYEGIINIKAVSREPGARAKIAVQSVESNLDPVGACVGVRGSRVQAIINELKGEKIDIIEYSSDAATFVVNALTPAKVLKVIVDEEAGRIEAVVSEQDFSIAIGRRGQNAKLASRITGWNIDLMTEEEEEIRRKEEGDRIYNLFVEKLGLDDISSRILISEGVTELEEVIEFDPEDLANLDGFDEDKAIKFVENAKEFYGSSEYRGVKWAKCKLNETLLPIKELDFSTALQLSGRGIRDIDRLADLSRDEFRDLLLDESSLEDAVIDKIIMQAREISENF